MNLHIVDMSNVIYTGAYNKHAVLVGPAEHINGKLQVRTIPTGGICFLFNIIRAYGVNDKIIFAADRTPNIKKGMCEDYKCNRTHDENVMFQKDMTEEILKQCGFNVYAREDYEADDVVYTLVSKYQNEFDHVYLHTEDSDYYFMVNDKVSTLAVKSNGKSITMENYKTAISSKYITYYNTALMNKVVGGDVTDCIKGVSKATAQVIHELFDKPFYYPKMGDIPFMRSLIKTAVPEALPTFDLVAPIYIDDLELGTLPEMNKARCLQWAELVGNKKFPSIPIDDPEVLELKNKFFDM